LSPTNSNHTESQRSRADSAVWIEDLDFSYGENQPSILKIGKLSILQGQRVFVFGPSGSGKSTFLELVAGVLTPKKGALWILGQDLLKLSASERDQFRADHLGYIFQSFNLIPYLTVRENILLALNVSPRKKKNVGPDVGATLLCLTQGLGVDQLLDRPVNQLSVGQQQRVAAARALIGSPGLILADEPTSALDFDHREKFIQSLFTVAEAQKTTILFVSHDRTLEKLFDFSFGIGAK